MVAAKAKPLIRWDLIRKAAANSSSITTTWFRRRFRTASRSCWLNSSMQNRLERRTENDGLAGLQGRASRINALAPRLCGFPWAERGQGGRSGAGNIGQGLGQA